MQKVKNRFSFKIINSLYRIKMLVLDKWFQKIGQNLEEGRKVEKFGGGF